MYHAYHDISAGEWPSHKLHDHTISAAHAIANMSS